MPLSKIKIKIVTVYNYLIRLLPVKLASRWIWVDRQMDWSISIYEGDNFLDLKPSTMTQNPAISRRNVTDAVAMFVADPFMVRVRDKWWMFFEIFNYSNHKGEIAVAQSSDGYKWDYQQVVLAEDFHLSYPYVFEFDTDWYMIPESCAANSVRLYQAKQFPDTWEFVSEILVGERFVDASILNFNEVWWIFVGVEPREGETCDTLRLYYADRLFDEWIEHPKSPIISNNRKISRPAGRMQQIGDRLFRFTQDCTNNYGYNITTMQIESLTKDEYVEVRVQPDDVYLFELGTMSCNNLGMHHLDFMMSARDRCIACVDSR
jgi:hypothetical protein